MLATLSTSPTTVIHGDYRADNIFFAADGRTVLLDFQLTGLGSPSYDLAYFVTQSLLPDVAVAHETSPLRSVYRRAPRCRRIACRNQSSVGGLPAGRTVLSRLSDRCRSGDGLRRPPSVRADRNDEPAVRTSHRRVGPRITARRVTPMSCARRSRTLAAKLATR